MNAQKPLLEVYADSEATRSMIRYMYRCAKISGFTSIVLAITFAYLIANNIENYRVLTGLGCILSAFFSYMFRDAIPGYKKELQELPVLYSFYPDGFICHRSGQKFYWEQIKRIHYTKTNIQLQMRKTPNIAEMSFICISEISIHSILQHFKSNAPERLSEKIAL